MYKLWESNFIATNSGLLNFSASHSQMYALNDKIAKYAPLTQAGFSNHKKSWWVSKK